MISVTRLTSYVFRSGICGVAALISGMVLAHFFSTGPYWHDAGWFSYLLDCNPRLTNPDGTSFYDSHVSPLLSLISGLNCALRAPRPIPLMAVLVGSFIVIASASYKAFQAAPTVASATLLSTVVISRQVFEFFRYPHYEIMALALFMPLWAAVTASNRVGAILSLALLLMVREDMGLHVGLLFLAFYGCLQGTPSDDDPGRPQLVRRLSALAIAYSLLAFGIQYVMSVRTGSMVERAIIGSGEQIGFATAAWNIWRVAASEALLLTFISAVLLLLPSPATPLRRLSLLAPYGLWSCVCSISQNPAMAQQTAYYSFPLFFVLVIGVTLMSREWSAVKPLPRVVVLLLACIFLAGRAMELRHHELGLSTNALSSSMRTFENVGAWRKLRGIASTPDLWLSHACASLWLTPASVARTVNLETLATMPNEPLLLMEDEHGADAFFRKGFAASGNLYAMNASSFILWVPEGREDFLAALPQAAGATPFNVFARTLITVPPARRIDGDIIIAAGQSGCCFYGPYVTIPEGRYRIHGKALPDAAQQWIQFDCLSGGQKPITSETVWNGSAFAFEFTIESDAKDFEFRCWANAPPAPIRLDDMRIERLSSAGQNESIHPGDDRETGPLQP